MDALEKLIEELQNSEVELASLLFRVQDVTHGYHSPELDDWIGQEITGYRDAVRVPEYRQFLSENWGEFTGPGPDGVTYTTLRIQTDDLPEQVRQFAEALTMGETMATLEAHGAEDDKKPWPVDIVTAAQESTAREGLTLVSAYQLIPAHVYTDIREKARYTLYQFLLDLKHSGPTAQESNQPEAVGQLVNYHIYGDGNVVSTSRDGGRVHQQVTTNIVQNDIESLVAYLKEQGIGDDDLDRLREIVSSEPIPQDGSYGPRLDGWVKDVEEKEKYSNWKAAGKAIGAMVSGALKAFAGG